MITDGKIGCFSQDNGTIEVFNKDLNFLKNF